MRYAFQIKQIKSLATKKVVKLTDEQKNAEKIKKLEEALAAAMAGGGGSGGGVDTTVLKKLAAEMKEMRAEQALLKAKEAKLQKDMEKMNSAQAAMASQKQQPHVMAIIQDPASVGLCS